MELFNDLFDAIRQYVDSRRAAGLVRTYTFDEMISWPRTKNSHVVFREDTAVELGHPSTESLSFMMWTGLSDRVVDGRITVIGPDMADIRDSRCSFGKVVLLRCHGLDEENTYDRYTELDTVRHRLKLQGYMLRAISQKMIEWSRISKKGLKAGFDFHVLGTELIREYGRLDYVDAAEVIFITSGAGDVRELKPVAEKAGRIIEALNRIFENLELDCDACSFQDICDEIEGLRQIHRAERR